MTTKRYDLAVKVGSYTDRDGNEKGRYLNIGAILQKDDGGKFILLDRTFNPAGLPNPEGRSNIIVSMFEPRESGESGRPQGRQQPVRDSREPTGPQPGDDIDDQEVPF